MEDRRSRDEEDGGKWQVISRRKKGGRIGERRKWVWPDSVVSYYISNLPEDCTKAQLRKECAHFGRVVDTFISNRKGRGGYRFGFVKFDGVRDKWMLEKVLGKIKMGNQVLSANVEKFDRNKNPIILKKDTPQVELNVRGPNVWSRLSAEGSRRKEEVYPTDRPIRKSYAAVASGLVESRKVVINDIGYSITREWMGISLVGKVADFDKLNQLHKILVEEGFSDTQIRYVGGLQILLTFRCGEEAEFFKKAMTPRLDLFSDLRSWEGQLPNREQLVWLKIVGIPPHLWDSRAFDQIGEKFGEVVVSSAEDEYDVNLAWKMVGILCSPFDKIDGHILVEWGREVHKCRISEVVDEWLPEFAWEQAGVARVPATPTVQSTVERVEEEKSTQALTSNEGVRIDVMDPLLADMRSPEEDVGVCQEDHVGPVDVDVTRESTVNPKGIKDGGPVGGNVDSILKKVGLSPLSSNSKEAQTPFRPTTSRPKNGDPLRSGPVLRSHSKKSSSQGAINCNKG
ncbi:hypothetical protein SSX86_016913 [Deinandra increscens subsp. villosa]|uniref:RRM domain-containing protein n=1 Tax=Deinandra increscens subsp. villosa TaxID=3103831 RepID=A0AAP0GTS9_9ASTR